MHNFVELMTIFSFSQKFFHKINVIKESPTNRLAFVSMYKTDIQ